MGLKHQMFYPRALYVYDGWVRDYIMDITRFICISCVWYVQTVRLDTLSTLSLLHTRLNSLYTIVVPISRHNYQIGFSTQLPGLLPALKYDWSLYTTVLV